MARGRMPGASGPQPLLLRLPPERAAEVAALLAERERREAAERRRDLVRSWLGRLLSAWLWPTAEAAVWLWAAVR